MDGVAFHEFYVMAPEILCPSCSPSSSSRPHSTDSLVLPFFPIKANRVMVNHLRYLIYQTHVL
ncbi:Arf-GAP with Rho-GAP domain, ANK repeat and PH domain-containing protein 1, partial [Clarias magur]